MRKIILGILFIIGSKAAFTQLSHEDSISTAFSSEFQKIADYARNHKISVEKSSEKNVNRIGQDLLKLLIEMERPTKSDKNISPATRALLTTKDDPYVLVLLERAINESDLFILRCRVHPKIDHSKGSCVLSRPEPLHLKDKLLKEVSKQINSLTKDLYPYYNYNTKEKQVIKFASIRSGNDLFTLAGLYDEFFMPKNKYMKDGGVFFQRNDDRDYTGSFLIELGTDYFKTLRKRPIKTYQTIFYGFDVYTPYFRDSIIFATDTSFNVLDRPHASFQYFGWSKKGLSKTNRYKWSTTVKFGKIGGQAGAQFQNALHQDISYSPRPRGWGAQIANGGRIGFSLELKEEFYPIEYSKKWSSRENDWKKLFSSFFAEQRIGTYMTTLGLGVQLSNKSFQQNNHNFIEHRIRQTTYNLLDHLMYNIAFSATYVIHNTMLEGYGIMSTQEKSNDYLTPYSRYYLDHDQVRRINYVLNTTVSYTTRFATIFYNWKSISPETTLSNIGIPSPNSGKPMNIHKRWHHFAEIGFTFNAH